MPTRRALLAAAMLAPISASAQPGATPPGQRALTRESPGR